MIALRDPVSLSRIDDEFVLHLELTQRAVEVRRLAKRHVRVGLAVHDQHRRTDLRRERDRAELMVAMRAWPIPAAATDQVGLQSSEVPGRGEHSPVADAGPHQGRLESVGLPHRPCGHESAVAPAADPEPVRVRDPVGDEQVDPADDVGPLVQADPARDRRGELMAMARATARVGQENRISRGGEPLARFVIAGKELVGVPVIGTAVYQCDERERAVLPVLARGQDQQPVEVKPVGGLVRQAFLDSPPDPAQFRPGVAEPDEPAAGRSGITSAGSCDVAARTATASPERSAVSALILPALVESRWKRTAPGSSR